MDPIVVLTRFDKPQVSLDKLPMLDRSSTSSRIPKLTWSENSDSICFVHLPLGTGGKDGHAYRFQGLAKSMVDSEMYLP